MIHALARLFQPKTDEEVIGEKGYNPSLLARIQPQGGLRITPSYVRLGDGYVSCIHVHKYQTLVTDFWLEQLMSIENTLVTLDIATANKIQIVEDINKSMAEQDNRFVNAKDNVDRINAKENYMELDELYNQITQGEVMKRVHLRVYVKGRTLQALEENVKEVLDELQSLNYRGTVLLNEQEWEWESLFTGYSEQLTYPNKRKGKDVPSTALAGGYPFHYTFLNDDNGTYYGTTETNGSVIFDLFHRDKNRMFYNALMIGKMGSGKSTLLKKTVMDQAIKGHKIRILDVTGEFSEVVKELNGKQIALDGSQGIINPLQVFKTVTNDDGSTNETLSFTQHLSKMNVFYHFINPSSDRNEATEFEILLRQLYVQRGLWSEDGEEEIAITNFPASEYPTFSDLLALVRDELYADGDRKKRREHVGAEREIRLANIELTIKNLVENYGNIFDGVSSIDHFDDELVVSFPLRNLTNLKDEIYQAQVFNIMNMLWDGMIVNGSHQFRSFNRGELQFNDATRYLIVIDEAHHVINTRDISQPAVLYLERFMRESRKYFGGIFFVSHVISDFVPAGSDSQNAENVKKLFQLTQYKFIGQQDAESMPTIQSVFDGQLTESEARIIPTLETGKVVLCISGLKNLVFEVDVSQAELAIFGGGA
ncbi:type IV secretion system protein VirB4 [Ammoniphilus oxalaticus]|uniref:Type IV secretion system protein VirB4 n=1 Tax=Ammoniphilus oxalaticus TaxID=66863 RepID=A0A419SQ28_9BACL|nr:type IV secretion system protein VirB4 [Ammoniphilus oxalaticus]RKD26500.1 type IV secretion system protein VirB4 [Ammoniphilus oxalaticus]